MWDGQWYQYGWKEKNRSKTCSGKRQRVCDGAQVDHFKKGNTEEGLTVFFFYWTKPLFIGY